MLGCQTKTEREYKEFRMKRNKGALISRPSFVSTDELVDDLSCSEVVLA